MAHCPNQDELQAWAAGQMASETHRWINAHVIHCERCLAVWERLGNESRPDGCPSMVELSRHQSGALDLERSRALGEHFAGCPHCASALKRLESLVAESQGSSPTRTDADSQERIRASLVPHVDGYEILSIIKGGGQGDVYKAVQLRTNRIVAIKVLREALPTAEQRERFRREVEIVANMRHAHVVTIFDSGLAEDDRPFYSMEFIDGQPLHEYLAAAKPSVEQRLLLFEAICDAVASAHERGVIHRDLKPGNVMVDGRGNPRVLDFGLARQTVAEQTEAAAGMTQDGVFLGTCAYAAPEQFAGRPELVTVRTDVFALGGVLYEMLTGRPPFRGGSFGEIERDIRLNDPVRPSAISRGLSGELDTIVLRAMSKDPQRRYESAAALGEDVRRFLAGEPIAARRDSAMYVLRKTLHRRRWEIGIGAVVLTLLIGLGYYGLRLQKSKHESQTLRASLYLRDARVVCEVDPEAALAILKDAIQLDPQLYDAELLTLLVLWRNQHVQQASIAAEEMLERNPEAIEVHILLARMLDTQDPDRAARHRRVVAERPPPSLYYQAVFEDDDQQAIRLLTQYLEDGFEYDAVLERLLRFETQRQYAAMLSDAELLIVNQPKGTIGWNLKGAALRHLRRFSEALDCYEESIRLRGNEPITYMYRALVLTALGRNDEAILDLSKAIALRPNLGVAYAARSLAQFQRDNGRVGNKIRSDCRMAMQYGAEVPLACYMEGLIRAHDGNLDDAIMSFSAAIERNGSFVEAYINRSKAYHLQRDFNNEILDLAKVIEIDAQDAEVYNLRGCAYEMLGDYVQAKTDFDRAIELDSTSPIYYYNRGRLGRLAGRYRAAVLDFDKSVARAPLNALPYIGRGFAYRFMGDIGAARRDFLQAIEYADPTDRAILHLQVWEMLMLNGRGDEAHLHLDAALGLMQSSDPWICKITQFLAGVVEEKELLQDATTTSRQCDAKYYMGAKALLAGQRESALAYFDECIDMRLIDVEEFDLARWHKERLVTTAPAQEAAPAK